MAANKKYDDSFEGMRNYTGDWLKAIYEQNKLILKGIQEMSAKTDALKVALDNLSVKVTALIAKATDLQTQVDSHAADDAAVQAATDQVNALADSIPA